MTNSLSRYRAVGLAAVVVGLAGGSPAWARDPAWTVSGEVGVVSDYRYRGLSLSGNDPSIEAGVTLEHATGFYAEAYAASIEEYGIGTDGDGAKAEITVTSGWAGSWAGLDVDAAISYFAYPDGSDVDYYEFPVEIARSVGDARFSAGLAWAPAQQALGDEDNRYAWLGLDYSRAHWPVEFRARVGHEDGAYAPLGKTDWLLGAEVPLGPLSLGLAWTDSDVDDGAVVASLYTRF